MTAALKPILEEEKYLVSTHWSRRGTLPSDVPLSHRVGPWPIRVYDDPVTGKPVKLELLKPADAGGTSTFTSERGLLRALHGPRGFGYNCSFDKYVRRGAYAPPESRYDAAPSLILVTMEPVAQLPTELQELVYDPSVVPVAWPNPQGIDLGARGHEVAKLLYKGFGTRIRQHGYEFEDVLQEVYRKLLVSNQGRSPWDPAKSSFGHFVYLVCRSALWNYHRSHLRRLPFEQLGLMGRRADGCWGVLDASISNRARTKGVAEQHPGEALESLSMHLLRQATDTRDTDVACLAVDILPLVSDGYERTEIAERLGMRPPVISKALAYMREHACTWEGSRGARVLH